MKKVLRFVEGSLLPKVCRVIPILAGLCFFLQHVAVAEDAQGILDKRISVHVSKVTVKEALKQLEAAAEAGFVYDQKIVAGRTGLVTLNATKEPLKNVLSQVLPASLYDYFPMESQIVIKLKENVARPVAKSVELPVIVITGTVKDPLDQPMAGVTVSVLNSGKATATDESGFFSIEANKGDSIEFTFVGYDRQVVIIKDRIELQITMQAVKGSMDEVVVVGFDKQKKISLVGAQSTVNVEELKLPTANVSTALAGRIAGVVGVQRTGEPGKDAADIWIRGISTFNASNDASPLILIDGVQRDLNSLDPEDIASFSVLKDASATAVYGVRGANGVVLITTKSGKPGKTAFVVNYNEGWTTFTRIPELTDGVTYMELRNEARRNVGDSADYSADYIAKTASGEDPYVYPNVNWMDALFNKWGHNRRLNVTSRGGSEKANYYVSLAYYDETGFLKTDGLQSYNSDTKFKRYNFTSNLNLELTSTTKFSLGVQGYITNVNYPGVSSSDAFAQAMQITPVLFPIMYPGGYVPGQSSNGDQRNPYADITQRGFQNIFGNQIYTNARVTQDLGFWLKGLSATTMFSFDSYNSQTIARTKRESTYYVDQTNPRNADGTLNLLQTWQSDNTNLGYSRSNGGNRRFYTETSIKYDGDFGGYHHVSGMLLYNQSDYTNAFAGDLISSIPYRFRGLAGRATYSFQNKYFAEVNFGYNGSENFAPDKRYGFFPSYGVGWIVSSEDFFKPLSDAVQFLKIRFSDGIVGAGSGGRRFGYQTLVESYGSAYAYGLGRDARNGITITDYGVDVTWATSHKMDLGVELKTFNNNISLVVDFFKEHREGVFLQRGGLADFVGLNSKPWGNLGVIDNKGIDLTLQTAPISLGKNTSIAFRGNFTYNKDKVIEDDTPTPKYDWLNSRGHNYLARFGYVAEGLFESQEDIDKSPKSSFVSAVNVGDIKYKDLNGDGVIDSYDQTVIGRGDVPSMVYGFGGNVTWKNFYIGVFFQGVAQADRLLSGDGIIPFSNSTGADRSNLYSIATSRWTEDNPSQDVFYPRLGYGNSANQNNSQPSTWWVKDISFLRLKTADLGYTFPKGKFKAIGVTNASLYVQGVNLLTFSSFKLWDPELNTSNGTVYPNVTTISVGLRANF